MTIDIKELRKSLFYRVDLTLEVQTIEELLDRLEAAERERDEGNRRRLEAADHFAAQTALMKEKCDTLRAKIEQMERQEPVKYEFQGRDGAWYSFSNQPQYENTVADGTWPFRALYTLPGAQTQGEEK